MPQNSIQPSHRPAEHRWFMFVSALIITAASVCTWSASLRRSVVGDELDTIWLASQSSAEFIIQKIRASDIHPPTPYLILHYWGAVAGYSDTAMRSLSWLFVLLSLATLWKLIPLWTPSATDDQRRAIWVLCVSAPVLWIQAVFARYYSLGTLVGLLSTFCYLRWRQRRAGQWPLAYVLVTAAAFYIHFFLAGIIVASQITHFLIHRRRSAGEPSICIWFLVQCTIAGLAAPIVLANLWPLLTSSHANLANTAPEGIVGIRALPIYLAGHLYTTLTGGIPLPWDFWITLPIAVLFVGLTIRDVFHERAALSATALSLVWGPFVLLALVIGTVVPVTGYFHGALRCGHIALLVWLVIGQMITCIESPGWRRSLLVLLITCNCYLIIVLGCDRFSMAQSTPVKAAVECVLRTGGAPDSLVVFQPFGFGWADPVQHYLPATTCKYIGDELTSSCVPPYQALVSTGRYKHVWVIQRNRFHRNAYQLSAWLLTNEYERIESTDLQMQREYDLRFKERMKRVSILHLSTEPSFKSYWTATLYQRRGTTDNP